MLDKPMRSRHSTSESRFFWPGALFVLPVLLLAALGVFSLRQDRAAVEQEGRQRAAEIARDLSSRLERQIASELAAIEQAGNFWTGDSVAGGRVQWPEPSAGVESRPPTRRVIETWQANYPALEPARVFPLEAAWTAAGELEVPAGGDAPPVPPAWLSALTPGQQSLWNELRSLDPLMANADALRAAAAEFLLAGPPPSAQANAEFILLFLDLRERTAIERVEHLSRFAQRHPAHLSESGLPLSSLALARALHESASIGLTEPLFRALSEQELARPSFITPRLIERLEQLAAHQSPHVQDAAARLRVRWESQQLLRARAQSLRESLRPSGLLTTNLWFDWKGETWLAVLNPAEHRWQTSSNGVAVTLTNPVTQVRFFPEPAVARAAELALTQAPVRLPPYLGAGLWLENRRLLVQPLEPGFTEAPVLASASGQLTSTGMRLLNPGAPEPEFGEPIELFPSHPRLDLRIVLLDPPLLYAQASRRARTFGALILAALAAALLGAFKTLESLRRQRELGELKSNFVSSVSHELRAPIASVRLMAEGLERGAVRDPEKQQHYFQFIVQECRRLSTLIENVLDFSRIERGRKQYEFEPAALLALVQDTVRLMEAYARERQVELVFHPDPALSASRLEPILDGKAIQQALINLIDNAVKHAPPNTPVTVGLAATASSPEDEQPPGASPGSFTLWVQDLGEGIPPEEHQRIFERFYRRGSELRRKTPGVGIGLSLVKHIVDAHGGAVRVESRPHQGARFIIVLPYSAVNRDP